MLEAWYIYKWLAIIYNDDQDEGILWSIIDMDHEFHSSDIEGEGIAVPCFTPDSKYTII